jgi:hypothetical protein
MYLARVDKIKQCDYAARGRVVFGLEKDNKREHERSQHSRAGDEPSRFFGHGFPEEAIQQESYQRK